MLTTYAPPRDSILADADDEVEQMSDRLLARWLATATDAVSMARQLGRTADMLRYAATVEHLTSEVDNRRESRWLQARAQVVLNLTHAEG